MGRPCTGNLRRESWGAGARAAPAGQVRGHGPRTAPHLTCLAPASCPRQRRSAARPTPCPPGTGSASSGSRRPALRRTSPRRRSTHAPRRRARSASSSRGRHVRLPTAPARLVRAVLAAVAAAERRRCRLEATAPHIPAPGRGSRLRTRARAGRPPRPISAGLPPAPAAARLLLGSAGSAPSMPGADP